MAKIKIDVPDIGCAGCRYLATEHNYGFPGRVADICKLFGGEIHDKQKCRVCEMLLPIQLRIQCPDGIKPGSAEYQAYMRAENIRLGICVRCKHRPAQPGHRMCEQCAEKSAECQADRRNVNIRLGLCVRCKQQPAQPGRRMCEQCAKKAAEYQADRHADYIRMGICTRCKHRPAQPGHRMCEQCAKKDRANRTSAAGAVNAQKWEKQNEQSE